MLADEARLRGKGRRKLVALRLGADHRLELFSRRAVQLPIDHQYGLGVLQRSFGFLKSLGGRRLADLEAARMFTEAQIVFRREEVLLVIETRHETRGAAIC